MRTGILVDASCDVPSSYTAVRGVEVIPVRIHMGTESFVDTRDATARQRYLQLCASGPARRAMLEPASPESMEKLLLSDLASRYDRIFCLTPAAACSPVYAHAHSASLTILQKYRQARAASGQTGAFLLRIIDTQTRSAGCAVVAAEALRLVQADTGSATARERLDAVSGNSYAWIVVRDPRTWRAQAQNRGQAKVGLVGSALDRKPVVRAWRGQTRAMTGIRGFESASEALLAHVSRRVASGLMVPAVIASYGGMLAELELLRGYADLAQTCRKAGVELLTGPMSVASMATFGTGSLAVGFACAEYEDSL